MEDFFKKLTGSGNRAMIYFYVGAVVIVVAQVVLLTSVLPNAFIDFQSKITLTETRKLEVSSYAKALKMLSGLDEQQIDSYLTKVLLALPDEKKTSGVISGMTALASTSGVIVTNLEFSPGFVATNSGVTGGV